MNCKISCCLFVILCSFLLTKATDNVPVLLWGPEISPSLINPLHKISSSEFQDAVNKIVGKSQPPILIFLKNNFCVEDIRQHRKTLQQLDKAGSLTYFTSVESPVSTFENLNNYNVTQDNLIESVSDGHLNFYQIHDNDLETIVEAYNTVANPDLIIGVTGMSCVYSSMERAKRAADDDKQNGTVFNTQNVLLYLGKDPTFYTKGEGVKELNDLKGSSSIIDGVIELNLISPTAGEFKLKFQEMGGYLDLSPITYTSKNGSTFQLSLPMRSNITFPSTFSYHCSQDTSFEYKDPSSNDKAATTMYLLKLSDFQMQINATKFGQVYDCVGFTSIPIWSGIFVTALLAIIMIWGLTMMMDIRTMDRFDDPKGKTISVNFQE